MITTEKHKIRFYCSICGSDIGTSKYGLGTNNAWPINNGRCCDKCNTIVILHRINALNLHLKKNHEKTIQTN